MKTKGFRNVSYIGLIVIILVFLFIYFSYFFMYIPRKEAQLEQKAFRILKEYGKNMIDKNRYYENHFKNYLLFYTIRHLKNLNEIGENDNINQQDTTLFNNSENLIKELFSFVHTVKMNHDSVKTISETENIFYLNYKNQRIKDTAFINDIKKVYKTINSEKKEPEITIESLLNQPFVNRLPVVKFMENLKFDELFEKITVFNDSTVFYNSRSEKIYDITNPEALKDTLNKSQGGIHKILNIRGEETHVLILPVKFRHEDFFIAGFISDQYFRQKTRHINTQLIIYLAGFLLLGFIGMPVLKIIFIDPRERLKAFDATASGISYMAGLGLITIITISLLKTQVADPVLNQNRIESVSKVLLKNVLTDINSIKKLGYLISQKTEIQDSGKTQPEIINPNDLPGQVIKHFADKSTKFKKVEEKSLKYPFQLNEIILIDSTGIVQKAYSRTPFSELVEFNLSDREYFKNVVDINKTWPETNLNYYIESIKSYNTNEFETAISFLTDQFDNLPVLAITSKIPSLYNQVLPRDMDFLIINKNGNVLYHSKTDKNLHENFIQECDSDPKLLKAIELRTKRNFTVNYDEKQWLARIQPIEDTPLFHITLLDLSQGRFINASIFLFTFFFSLVSFLFVAVVFLVLSIFIHSNDNARKHEWILQWIILEPQKYKTYVSLIVILTIIAAIQILGFYFTDSPEQNFVYQLILSCSVLIISILKLNDNWSDFQSILKKPLKYLPVSILALILFTLIVYILIEQNLIFKNLFIAVAPLFVFILYFIFYFKLSPEKKPKEISGEKLKQLIKTNRVNNIYLAFLMLWLINIAVIPVVEYYLSFNKQETEHRIEDIKLGVALKNINLISDFEDFKTDYWFQRIQGNEIDSMIVSSNRLNEQQFFDAKMRNEKYNQESNDESELHDLVFGILNFRDTFSTENYSNYWISNDSVYFKQGKTTGYVKVSYSGKNFTIRSFWYVLVVILIAGIVLILIWYLLRYIANVILNLKQEEPFTSKLSWFEMLITNKHKKILLNSFDGGSFLNETQKMKRENKILKINNLKASQLISPEFDLKKIQKDKSDIFWINEFQQVIYSPDSHEKLISNIKMLNEKTEKTVVLDLPYDIGFIYEFFEDYSDSAELEPEELKNIFLLKKKWAGLFEEYFHFNGFLQENGSQTTTVYRIEDRYERTSNFNKELQFYEIWNNLTSYEKIVLHDLAEDGLLNRKDNSAIKNLINKRLITPNPYPQLFSHEFGEFILQKMKSKDIKLIETKLGLKGRWHNARYIILLIIIPLTAFILISQGLSLEKIFGIFAAGIAAVTGLMRLFDSNIFSQN